MKVIGQRMSDMVEVLKDTPMEIHTRANFTTVRLMVMEFISGLLSMKNMMANGSKE